MSTQLLTRFLFTWLLFIPLAILNGLIRQHLYGPHLSELTAHQLSTLIACLAFFSLAYLLLHSHLHSLSLSTLIIMGLTWALLTISFEFLFGHFVIGHSWSHLLTDYQLHRGRLWSLFILTTISTPLLIHHFSPTPNSNSHQSSHH